MLECDWTRSMFPFSPRQRPLSAFCTLDEPGSGSLAACSTSAVQAECSRTFWFRHFVTWITGFSAQRTPKTLTKLQSPSLQKLPNKKTKIQKKKTYCSILLPPYGSSHFLHFSATSVSTIFNPRVLTKFLFPSHCKWKLRQPSVTNALAILILFCTLVISSHLFEAIAVWHAFLNFPDLPGPWCFNSWAQTAR